jgi:hypothetical protein
MYIYVSYLTQKMIKNAIVFWEIVNLHDLCINILVAKLDLMLILGSRLDLWFVIFYKKYKSIFVTIKYKICFQN